MSEIETMVQPKIPPEEMSLLKQIAKKENTDVDSFCSRIIHEKVYEKEHHISPEDEVALLDSVVERLNETDELQAIRDDFAGLLLVAEIERDIKAGKFDREKTLGYIKELF